MITFLSPAKDLNFDPIKEVKGTTEPLFLDKSTELATVLKKKSAKQISKLMDLSEKLSELNYQRYQLWSDSPNGKGKTAIHAFNGEVYRNLQAHSLKAAEMRYAQDHLRILSGLYGMLRPKDLIMAYRLEMGTKLKVKRKKNLYEFWGHLISDEINKQIAVSGSKYLVNLASQEYFKAVKPKDLDAPLITPVFKDLTPTGVYKTKFLYAKQQRGKMTRYICQHHAMEPSLLKSYDLDGYYFSEEDSTESQYVFLRDKVQ